VSASPAGAGTRAGQRGAAAALLGCAYLLASRRVVRVDAAHGRTRGRAAAGALCAGAGPALLVAQRLASGGARWQPPPSAAGRTLLSGYVLAGALLEEVLWRAPLILLDGRTGDRALAGWAVLSGAGFLALHLRRDGARSLPVHLTTTTSWTASALLARQLRWPVLAHAGYNLAAISLRDRGTDRS
jgi:hypothetical protein